MKRSIAVRRAKKLRTRHTKKSNSRHKVKRHMAKTSQSVTSGLPNGRKSTEPSALAAGEKAPEPKQDVAPLAPAPKEESNAPALIRSGQLITGNDLDDFDTRDTGLENVTSRDLMIPRLTILQALSPQLNRQKSEYIEGAEQGDICDVGTGKTFKELFFVPCYYARVFIEWAPRSTGKGLIQNHGLDGSIMKETFLDDKRRNVLRNGNYIAETAQYYGINLSDGKLRSFIPFAATQLKASRKWLTAITNERLQRPDGSEFMPPAFFRAWRASTVMTSNSEGSWYLWKWEPFLPIVQIDPTRQLLQDCKEFTYQAANGLVQGDLTEEDLMPDAGNHPDVRESEDAPM